MEQVLCVGIWYIHGTLLCAKVNRFLPLQMEELKIPEMPQLLFTKLPYAFSFLSFPPFYWLPIWYAWTIYSPYLLLLSLSWWYKRKHFLNVLWNITWFVILCVLLKTKRTTDYRVIRHHTLFVWNGGPLHTLEIALWCTNLWESNFYYCWLLCLVCSSQLTCYTL